MEQTRRTSPAAATTARAEAPVRVVAIAGFDSQLKWSVGICRELESRGAQVEVLAPRGRSALSDQQVRDVGFSAVRTVDWDDAVEAAAARLRELSFEAPDPFVPGAPMMEALELQE